MWILLTPLAAYISKLSALAPARLGSFVSALDVYMTHCKPNRLRDQTTEKAKVLNNFLSLDIKKTEET